MNFKELGINDVYVDALAKQNITKPTPVQEKTIPLALQGKHLMVQSKTGTGKTLAFTLPIVENLKHERNEALILVPTRELAKQVQEVVESLGDNIKSLPIYGGVSINNQIDYLKKGINIICGTPGRIIDLYKRGELDFSNIRFVVLDEADRLWDMGFSPDIKYILQQIKTKYQFMLFSATLDPDIRDLVKKYSKNDFQFLNLSRDDLTVRNTLQFYYIIDRYDQKFNTFVQVLRKEKPKFSLIFTNTKKTASWLANKLSSKNNQFRIGLISGDLTQYKREKILKHFKERKINMLIATDVAARGLDIDNITHVFNYDVPKFPENYVHRIGRTSRMNKKGIAITM
ncbi:MAG: DEAD/DEAH box helicase, partial [Promethearchaeota archaeon]